MRIFKPMPSIEIAEAAEIEGKNVTEVGKVLAGLGHPQCLSGTTRETESGEDNRIEWRAKHGGKG